MRFRAAGEMRFRAAGEMRFRAAGNKTKPREPAS
jgi:hypothetical protein